MHKRLLAFIEKENIIDNIQFGFRARHSTDHAILNIIDKIQHAIDSRDISCGIFLISVTLSILLIMKSLFKN